MKSHEAIGIKVRVLSKDWLLFLHWWNRESSLDALRLWHGCLSHTSHTHAHRLAFNRTACLVEVHLTNLSTCPKLPRSTSLHALGRHWIISYNNWTMLVETLYRFWSRWLRLDVRLHGWKNWIVGVPIVLLLHGCERLSWLISRL